MTKGYDRTIEGQLTKARAHITELELAAAQKSGMAKIQEWVEQNEGTFTVRLANQGRLELKAENVDGEIQAIRWVPRGAIAVHFEAALAGLARELYY